MPSALPKSPQGISSGAQTLVGYDIEFIDGRVRIVLQIKPQHLNRNGSLHGGIIAMMLDAAGGFSASLSVSEAGNVPVVTLSLTTQFIAAGVGGQVVATGTHNGGGRSIRYCDSELRDAAGTLLATASGAFKVIRERPKT